MKRQTHPTLVKFGCDWALLWMFHTKVTPVPGNVHCWFEPSQLSRPFELLSEGIHWLPEPGLKLQLLSLLQNYQVVSLCIRWKYRGTYNHCGVYSTTIHKVDPFGPLNKFDICVRDWSRHSISDEGGSPKKFEDEHGDSQEEQRDR